MTPLTWAGDAEVLAAREEKIRQSWIGVMETRLVREELAKCWRTEGVNHYEVCHHLTAKYLDMLRENRVRSFAPSALAHLTHHHSADRLKGSRS